MNIATRLLTACLVGLAFAGSAIAQDLLALEEAAVQAAVARVAPTVVRIETVGGLERVGKVLIGEGPTTGLIVSPDGFILSSSFNFAQQPSSILVTLPDGVRLPARRVATDHNRMVTLLKIEPPGELPVPEAAPLADVRVGAWAIAVGRTFEGDEPNVSVGIVSALARIWGKAIQTDAKISPVNYGGPLVDIEGRVLGLLVPLAPDATGDASGGVDWYDSGIGFAVSLEQLLAMLPRLKMGEDLHPGVLGISLKGKNVFADPAELAIVRPNSPAYKAGFKPGDVIVEVAGQAIARQAQLKSQLNPRYAGDTVHVVALRGEERIERDLQLVDKLLPYDRPFLGILPVRQPISEPTVAAPPAAGAPATEAPEQPVVIRYVYPDSPAAQAGLSAGDSIVAIADHTIRGRDDLADRLAAADVGDKLVFKVQRESETLAPEATLAVQPTVIPADLPAASQAVSRLPADRPPVGRTSLKLPEFKNDCLLYVPNDYDPRLACGVVVWLHGPNGLKEDETIAAWSKLCDAHNLILVAPKAANAARWTPPELDFIRKVVDSVRATYATDANRVVAAGSELGGQIAYVLAFANPDLVRGVAAIDAPLSGRVVETDPAHPLAIYTTKTQQGRTAAAIATGIDRLQKLKFPVTVHDLGETGRDLSADELAEMVRWVDSLDRL